MKTISTFFLNHKEGNPRNSEGSFVRLKDGRILLAYTKYRGIEWQDHSTADIASVVSEDEGLTWKAGPILVKKSVSQRHERIIAASSGWTHCYGVSRKSDMAWQGKLFVDCRPKICFSDDETETWSPTLNAAQMQPSYLVMNNDRLVQTSTGRLICPAAMHICTSREGFLPGVGLFFISDDGGKTWGTSNNGCYPPEGLRAGLMEPGVIELERDHLMVWYRTFGGCQYTAHSYDNGMSWNHPQPAPEFLSPESPMSMKRDSVSGDLFAIWNNYHPQFSVKYDSVASWGRTPLVLARSHDNGKTWQDHVVLEDAADHGFAYTAMFFDRSKLYLEYCCGCGRNNGAMLQDCKIRVLDLAD